MGFLFGGGQQKAEPAEKQISDPVRMPDPNNPALARAEVKKRAAQSKRSGRYSTDLTSAMERRKRALDNKKKVPTAMDTVESL